MKRKSSSKKSAFSLIELSIVMIIIGLLVAGVTGGAALIKNAETRAILAESQNYKTLVTTFYGTYNYVPGDYPQVLAALPIGNGDGIIEFLGSNSGASAAPFINETYLAWQQLRQLPGMTAGLVSATYAINNPTVATTTQMNGASAATSTATTGAARIDTHIPGSRSKGGAWVFDYVGTTPGVTAWATSPNKNVLMLLNPVVPAITAVGTSGLAYMTNYGTVGASVAGGIPIIATAPTNNVGIMTPVDAQMLDSKADDGAPATGTIRAVSNYVTPVNQYSCYAAAAAAPSSYETGNQTARSSKNCALTFDLDI